MLAIRQGQSLLRLHNHLRNPAQLDFWAAFARQAAGKPAAKPTPKKASDEGKLQGNFQQLLKLLKPMEVDRVELTPEEQAEYTTRSKEYSRRMMREHHVWQSDLATKLRLKKAALAALPDDLMEAALIPDLEPFPADRWIPTHTPPIEGYEEQQRQRISRGAVGRSVIGNKNQ